MVNTRSSCKQLQDKSVLVENERKIVYNEANLKAAVNHVIQKRLSYREASAYYKIARSTLQRKVKSILNGEQVHFKSNWGNYKPTFNDTQGEQLYKYLKLLEQRQIILSKREFLRLAFEFAERMKINHRFSNKKKIAGDRFYHQFIKRYSNLKFRRNNNLNDESMLSAKKIDLLIEEFMKLLKNHIFDPIYVTNEAGLGDENGNDLEIL